VNPGGSGKADEEEEEEVSWSSTAQRRARPLPFSIASGRCCCRARFVDRPCTAIGRHRRGGG
jgi:hypothetical protein